MDELRGYLHRFAAFLGEAPAGRVLQALVGHAQLDARTRDLLHGGFLDELTARDTERIRQCLAGRRAGAETGAGPETGAGAGTAAGTAEGEAAAVLEALLAPLYYRALLARGPIDAALVDATLDRQLDRQPGAARPWRGGA